MRITGVSFLFTILSFIVLTSCSSERRYIKERVENGNNLSFTYFKEAIRSYSSWSEYVPENGIDAMTVIYFGGQTEISNKDYWKFLDYLNENDSTAMFEKHKPKTDNWLNYSNDFNFADSMAKHYDSLDLFGNYPVVNITPDDAIAYVNWLNEIEPNSTIIYGLFTEEDWLTFFNEDRDIDSSFAWDSYYWRNSSQSPLGNFAEFDQNQIRYNQLSDKISWYDSDSIGYLSYVNGPMKCWSYNPNYWGAYNMSGNVAEITSAYFKLDGKWYCKTRGGSWHSPVFYLREIAEETYQLPSPYVGFRIMKYQYKKHE